MNFELGHPQRGRQMQMGGQKPRFSLQLSLSIIQPHSILLLQEE